MAVQKRVEAHRQRLREAGLRPIQLWLPDTRTLEFGLRAQHEAIAVNLADSTEDIMVFLDEHSALSDTE